MIDLRSDTVTRPTKPMLEAMFSAKVGDDVFHDDPTVITLEEKAAVMFGMQAAVFCPSGTMTNQIAIKAHTSPGEEIICDAGSHIYLFEGGGIGLNSGCSVKPVLGDRGRIKASDVIDNINDPGNEHLPLTRLVSLENTSNKGGGSCYNFSEITKITEACRKNGLSLHLDGARLFNALVEKNETPRQYGAAFDSISICLSKGLGAPVGSLLLGSKDFISRARRYRKSFGGGMRQSGYLAAAGIYALDNNISRLKEDHKRAKEIEKVLLSLPFVESVMPVETNIVLFTLDNKTEPSDFISRLKEKNILMVGFGKRAVRAVTHLDFNDDDLQETIKTLKKIQ